MRERILIWQQLHLRTPGQGRLWAVNQRLLRRLNPEADFLVIDNASPLEPTQFTPDVAWISMQLEPMDEYVPELPPNVGANAGALVRFAESLGHFFHGHTDNRPVRDGPGRAHDRALRIAQCSGYRSACYVEADALFRRPVQWCFDQMSGPVGCQPRCAYGYLDWHVWPVKDVAWLVSDFDFLGRYDWKSRVGEPGGEKCGEHVYADIFGEHLEVVPMTGIRGDTVALTEANFGQHGAADFDYITHVSLRTFALWLEATGHGDLAPELFP